MMSKLGAIFTTFLVHLHIFAGEVGGGGTWVVAPQQYKDLDRRLTLRERVGLEARGKIPGTDIDAIRSENSLYTDPSRLLILPSEEDNTKTLNAMIKLKEKHF